MCNLKGKKKKKDSAFPKYRERTHGKIGGNKIPFLVGPHWLMFLLHAAC